MNAKRVILILIVVVMLAAVWGVSAAAADSSRSSPTHPPRCHLVKPVDGVLMHLECYDTGGDINEAFVMKSTVPLEWTADWDGGTASIIVYDLPPSPDRERIIYLWWCVGDAAGNTVIGMFTTRPRIVPNPFPGALGQPPIQPMTGVAIDWR